MNLMRDKTLIFGGLNVSLSDDVLEIGSGHNPCLHSDVLVDKHRSNDERGGELSKKKPLVIADAHSLPFRNNAFDYVIARHVLEHVDDPGQCVQEMQRVASSGYIETPSIIWEKLHPMRKYHEWYVIREKNGIAFSKKKDSDMDLTIGWLMEGLSESSIEYHLLMHRIHSDLYVKHEWEGFIDINIYDGDEYASWENPWTRGQLFRWSDSLKRSLSIKEFVTNAISFGFFVLSRPLRRILSYLIDTRRLNWSDVSEKMSCPNCAGTIRFRSGCIVCSDCDFQKSVEKGVLDLEL